MAPFKWQLISCLTQLPLVCFQVPNCGGLTIDHLQLFKSMNGSEIEMNTIAVKPKITPVLMPHSTGVAEQNWFNNAEEKRIVYTSGHFSTLRGG